MTKGFYNNILFRFPTPHAAEVTKTTDLFSRYTCVMLDYAPFQKYARYVISAYVPLCVQHIVLDTNQIPAINVIITKYPGHTEFTLFYYRVYVILLQNLHIKISINPFRSIIIILIFFIKERIKSVIQFSFFSSFNGLYFNKNLIYESVGNIDLKIVKVHLRGRHFLQKIEGKIFFPKYFCCGIKGKGWQGIWSLFGAPENSDLHLRNKTARKQRQWMHGSFLGEDVLFPRARSDANWIIKITRGKHVLLHRC